MKYEPLIANRFYHIYNRGNNKEAIFLEEKNYSYFLNLMKTHLSPVSKIYSYCLLKNHFHLLIETREIEDDKNISRAFSNLFNAYAKAINKSYCRTGSLFQDRFQRKLIKDEAYLKTLIIYIHLNPEKHGLVEDYRKYKYSSFPSLIVERPSSIERQAVLNYFDGRENFISSHNHRKAEIMENTEDIFLE